MIVMFVKCRGGLLSPVAFNGHVWQFKIMMCLLVLLSPLTSAANHEKAVAVEEPQPAAPLQLQKDLAGEVLMQAMSLTGIAYRFGGQSPATGFDCSGLIRFVFLKSVGYELPRTAAEQARQGRAVGMGELQAGDIVFFNTRGFRFSHSGIYLGKGKFIHAPSAGKTIGISDMTQAYWVKRFDGARRILQHAKAKQQEALVK